MQSPQCNKRNATCTVLYSDAVREDTVTELDMTMDKDNTMHIVISN
jgi:hypothetical protein